MTLLVTLTACFLLHGCKKEKKSDKLPLDLAKSGKADWVIDRVAERGVGGENAEDVAYVAKQV